MKDQHFAKLQRKDAVVCQRKSAATMLSIVPQAACTAVLDRQSVPGQLAKFEFDSGIVLRVLEVDQA